MCLRDRPPALGSSLILKKTLLATTTSDRSAMSLRAPPRISSLTPNEYISAVSKKLTPNSSARSMIGRLSSSVNIYGRHFLLPKVSVPRQIRDTLSPELPRFTYSILFSISHTDLAQVCIAEEASTPDLRNVSGIIRFLQ